MGTKDNNPSRMFRLLVICFVCILILFDDEADANTEQWIHFKTAPVKNPSSQSIRGIISKPSGVGPFPAIIIAHGCFGVEDNHHVWANRLNNWGYVAIIVDSFTTRNENNVCSKPKKVSPRTRANDVYGAASHLRKEQYVDPDKIGVIGFSHGGWTALYVSQEYLPKKAKEYPLQAVVSFYPWCEKRNLTKTKTPLLILAGKNDTWTPVDRCKKLIKAQRTGFEKNIILIEYDNAYHGFDDANFEEPVEHDGYRIQFNADAAQNSIDETKAFLTRYLSD